MATQDKEKIKELTRRIKDLEATLSQKDQLISDYTSIEKIADEKIKGLNAIHADKVRSLMNSIQLLKKENAGLSKQQKEHKRSELIQQLNKDIADQDVVIDVLRKLINDDKKADNAVIAELSKGPARIRIQTREELKMELKDLKAKLLKYEKKKDTGEAQVEEPDLSEDKARALKAELRNNSIITNKSFEQKMVNGNADLILKINDLNNEIEDLKLMVAGKTAETDKYKELIGKKNQEIIELNQAKVDLKFILTKNEELKGEIDVLRQKLNSDAYNNYDQQIRLDEIEMVNDTHKNMQSKTQEVARMEVQNIQGKLEELQKNNKLLLSHHNKAQTELKILQSQNDELKDKNAKIYATQSEELVKLQNASKEKDKQLKAMDEKLKSYEDRIDSLMAATDNQEKEIRRLEEKLKNNKNPSVLDLSAIRHEGHPNASISVDADELDKLSKSHEKLEGDVNSLDSQLTQLKQENNRLRLRLKEMTKLEIELRDEIDLLQEENRLKDRKLIAMNLVNKKGLNENISQEELQVRIKKVSATYETKIRDLCNKIEILEQKNQNLEEIKRIIQSKANAAGSLDLASMNDSNLEQ